ncbi:hypothetical protein [Methylomarinovum tepidoasis]|nr:hypothetical protein [Methylomarinovum sp. IN45]
MMQECVALVSARAGRAIRAVSSSRTASTIPRRRGTASQQSDRHP